MLIKCNAILFRKCIIHQPFERYSNSLGQTSRQYHPKFKYNFRRFLRLEFKKLTPCLHGTSSIGCDSHHPASAILTGDLQLLHAIVKLPLGHQDIERSQLTHIDARIVFQFERGWARNRGLAPGFVYQSILSMLSRSLLLFLGGPSFYFNPGVGIS